MSAIVFIAWTVTTGISSNNKPEQDKNDANYQIARWTAVVGQWTRWLVIVGAITAAVLTIQAIILINQLGEMRTDQRAWIAPIGARLNGELITGQPINVLVDFANSGKEPALNLINVATAGISFPMSEQELTAELKFGPAAPSAIDRCAIAIPRNGFPAIYPATVQHQAADIGNAWIADDAVLNRKRIFFLHGCFGYLTMSEVHHSQYCFWLNMEPDPGTGKPHFRPCIVGNHAD